MSKYTPFGYHEHGTLVRLSKEGLFFVDTDKISAVKDQVFVVSGVGLNEYTTVNLGYAVFWAYTNHFNVHSALECEDIEDKYF